MSEARVSFVQASPEVEAVVREWFGEYALPRKVDGGRSVRIAHPNYEWLELKIKGAGYNGGPIRFGSLHQSNLKRPVFDFEGRMMEDVASGHDNAFLGGASFHQTIAEHRMSLLLERIRVRHIPCIGYGKIETDTATSWFSLHDWDPRLSRVMPPAVSLTEFASAQVWLGKELLSLALRHNVIGHANYSKLGDQYLLMDLHPFRQIDSFNMSQVSWVMQVLFNLHIVALGIMRFCPTGTTSAGWPPDIQAYPFRCALPDANRDDHESLRWTVIAPYMRGCPPDFSMRKLCDVLSSNRISRALLDLCPEEFARP